jgi:hypothetical protein
MPGVNAQSAMMAIWMPNVNTKYTGLRQEYPHDLMDEYPQDQREKKLQERFDLPTYKVDKSSYSEQKGTIPIVDEYLHVLSPNYATISGRRLFINPDLFDRSRYRLPADSVRHYDFINKEAFTEIDSVTIKIPAGYEPEAVPEDFRTSTANSVNTAPRSRSPTTGSSITGDMKNPSTAFRRLTIRTW